MMKALSLTQPWATAVALGAKRIETRSWATKHRGEIALHAAKGYKVYELLHFSSCWNWIGALWQTGVRFGNGPNYDDVLPFGAIIAVATLVDCRPTGSFTNAELDTPRMPGPEFGEFAHLYQWNERQMGDFSLGRYGFVLDNVQPLAKPVPWRGALGLWPVPLELHELMLQADGVPPILDPTTTESTTDDATPKLARGLNDA